MARAYSPFVKSKEGHNSISLDFAVALVPIIVWSVFMFGARVLTLCAVAAVVACALDYCVLRFGLKRESGVRIDASAIVYAILAVLMMPVSVPLYFPIISSVLAVIAKNVYLFRGRRLFNPFVFSAAAMSIVFSQSMTAFTKPFAYFSAFDITIDPILLDNYRVISPLQYMADGSVYEDGVLAQLYGFASGCMGEIAVFAIIVAAIWLFWRKSADIIPTATMIFAILILALIFPSADAESAFYAYSVLLSGSIAFLSLFALNESCTVPQTLLGKTIFALICGCVIFVLRKTAGGFEWGYVVVLALNVASPFIDWFLRKFLKAK